MDGQIDLFDYLEAATDKAERKVVPADGKDLAFSAMDVKDKAKERTFDSSGNGLESFIRDGFIILQQPLRFPEGLKTKWQPIELLLLENGKFVTCLGSYKDMTFRRSEHVKASLIGWKEADVRE